MTVADRIKAMREYQGLTQEELAKKIGYADKTSISKIENSGDDVSMKKVRRIADALGVRSSYLMGWGTETESPIKIEVRSVPHNDSSPRRIPVLGKVAAGIPIEMVEDVIDWEEIPGDMKGEYFALKIEGDSMEPKISQGDVVIVKKQDDVDNGDIAIVTVNGEDATCKRVFKYADALMLMSTNPKYPPREISKEQAEKLPVRILGKVVELRAKF